MKKTIFLLLLLPMLASAQYFDVFDIDTSEYPIMKAKFYSIDANGKQILNHTPSDFEITENGEPRDVISVSCPDPLPRPISVGIMVDTKIYINLARHGSERLVNLLDMPQNEVAITYMNQRPLLYQDFTYKKQKAIQSSRAIPEAPGGTKVSEMFFDDFAGGINIIKNRKAQNRVLVFISDLHCPNLDIEEQKLFQDAIDNNIRIYTVLIGTNDYTGLFGRIVNQTNGTLFENVRDSIEIENIFEVISYKEQNDPCEMIWRGGIQCGNLVKTIVKNKVIEKVNEHNVRLSDNHRAILNSDTYFIYFGKLNVDEPKDTSLTLIAKNYDQVITDIKLEPDNIELEIFTPLPLIIPRNGSSEIKFRFTPKDDSTVYTKMEISSEYCNTSIGILTGDKSTPLTQRSIKLTHPNGYEEFVAGTDTVITWMGITKEEKVKLNFSSDNGNSWSIISESSIGLMTNWLIPNIKSDSCLISIDQNFDKINTNNKTGQIEWQKSYGGNAGDQAFSIKHTFDNGYIIAGRSNSGDGDRTIAKGYNDYWIVKLSTEGELEWQKSYGGSWDDNANSIFNTIDGGYIVAGTSASKDGDITLSKGNGDYWVVKLTYNGELEWQKSYGGSLNDEANSIIQTSDGGYIVAGTSASEDGDITLYKRTYDYWIVKLSTEGELEWQKSYGGNGSDMANSIIQTRDGGYIVAGNSDSNDGDLTLPKGSTDYWIVKLSLDGELEWQKSYGGSQEDVANSIIQTSDGGYIVAGKSNSADGDITDPRGLYDYWIVKLSTDGELEWQKSYGSFISDDPSSLIQTIDGGYIIVGNTEGSGRDVTIFKGSNDYWIVKLRTDGELEWQKSYGGSKIDIASSIIQNLNGSYVIAGSSNSENGDITSPKRNGDFWIVKIAGSSSPLQSDTSDAVFSIIIPEPVIQNNDIDMGEMIVGSTKDTTVSSVICNIGDAPLHVLGVDITGGDAGDFLIPRGAGDFYLNNGECQDMMFEFTPSTLGNRTAVATIRTTIGDFKDTIHIRGVGINPIIKATAEVVDFGKFELGNGKDTTVVLVKNVGSTDITITDTRISGPDLEQFTLKTSPVNYTIAAGEEKEFQLNYTAKLGGKTNSFLDFYYNGIGSPIRSLLFAEGVGGEVYPRMADAYVGENVNLNILLGKIKPEGLREVATNFTATVSYNSSLLAPVDKSMSVSTEDDKSYIKITGQLSDANQIAAVPMKVGLGTDDRSGLVITEFQLYDANGDSVDYDIEPGVGEFNVLGICEEGGKRLINPNGEVIMQVIPENQFGNARVSLTLIESGQTELIVFDQIGNQIETIYSGTPSAGQKEINLDLSKYANGRYYIKLTTPTIIKTEIIEVVR